MNSSSTFRMIPNTKQRIFVVKSNIGGSRFIQNVIHPKQQDAYEISNVDSQNKRPNEATKNSQIDRLMSLPSNLTVKNTDSVDEQVIKNVLNSLVQKVVRSDQSNGWHQSILLRNNTNQPQPSTAPKRYCTYRPIEEKLQPYVERLRIEINKRRHRIEIECANDLGLISPWRKTRYRKAPKYEEERPTGPINPETISLNPDDPLESQHNSSMTSNYDQQFNQQTQFYPGNSQMTPSIVVSDQGDMSQHYVNFDETANEERTLKRFKPSIECCSVCDRECRKQLFCLCCNRCGRRFHGKCVKMTVKRLNKRQTPWLCDECVQATAEPKEDLFCVCKKPYDSRQFYVGCDGGCEGWFHPECVGTSQQEVESIQGESFICPNCRRNAGIRQNFGYNH